MRNLKRRISLGVAIAAVGLAAPFAAGSAAFAAPADVTQVSAAAAASSWRVSNLHLDTRPQRGGGSYTVFKLNEAPSVTGSGEYFVYNPGTESVEDLLIGGDAIARTTANWQTATFTPQDEGTRQLRFGDVNDPSNAKVVAEAVVIG